MAAVTAARAAAAAALCAAAAFAATGCSGGGDKDGGGSHGHSGGNGGATANAARGTAEKAVAATRAAGSVHVTGEVASAGRRARVDLALTDHGSCTGTVRTGRGASAQLRKKGGTGYVKGDHAFWKAVTSGDRDLAAAAERVENRWLRVPAGAIEAAAGGTDPSVLCDIGGLLGQFDPRSVAASGKGARTTVGGRAAVPVTARKDGGTQTAYVAAHGTPYVLRLTVRGGQRPGSYTFRDFGEPVRVSAPPRRETVDFTKLLEGPAG